MGEKSHENRGVYSPGYTVLQIWIKSVQKSREPKPANNFPKFYEK